MRLLFLGYAVSELEANSLSGVSIAGNRMQLGLIYALTSQPGGVIVDAVTVLPIASLPKDPSVWIRDAVIDIGESKAARRVGFLNVPVLKQFTQIVAVLWAGTKLATAHKYDYVLTYNMFPQVGLPARWIGRLFAIPIVCLLADPPVDHLPNRRGLSKVLRRAYEGLTSRLIGACAGVIVLNDLAADRYAPQAARLLMDGAVDVVRAPASIGKERGGPRRVVFTRALVDYNGIVELVEAMRLVRCEDLVLDIYGDGPLAELASDAARTNARINYHGRVSGDAIAEIQSDAFLLISPRRIHDPVSEVTFPSKILEYMLSGTAILTTRLNGFTHEYDDKVFFVNDDSAPAIAAAIDDLAGRDADELRVTAARAREFVIMERSWKARGELILRFLTDGLR